MKKATLLLLLIFAVLFNACDEKAIIIPDGTIAPSERVVLVEEITGVHCVNCPNAARQITSILSEVGDNAITIAYHVFGSLGDPYSNSKYNFRFEEGSQTINYIGDLFGVPAASINRSPYDGNENYSLFPDRWRGYILSELQREVLVNLSYEKTYNEATRTVDMKIKMLPRKNIDRPLRLTALVTESHIIDPQLDIDGKVEDYEHNHAVRSFISPNEGLSLGNQFNSGELVEQTFSYTLPAEAGWWKAENCNVVFFVHEDGSDSKEILQAGEFHIVE